MASARWLCALRPAAVLRPVRRATRRGVGALVEALDQTYDFTDWKRLDWAAVHDPLAGVGDWDETVRRLVEAVPDGHVLLERAEGNLCPEAAGSAGVLFSEVDDGSILVERRRGGRVRLLGRGRVGAALDLTLDRAGRAFEVTLEVRRDGDDLRAMLGLEPPEARISARMLTSDVGYLAIGWEETAVSDAAVRREVRSLWRDGARKLVLDLHDNDGGTDQTAANIAGVFTDRAWFYETITMYDRRTEGQAVVSDVWVEPQEVRWDLPVVALIHGNTVSSGEGIAMMLARFDGVEVVGFEGTSGSFGSSGSTAKLPGGWTLTWPAGRSLDASGTIQLDSDHTLEGGVAPTHRIPWTAAHRIAWAADPEGFEIDYAVGLLEAR